MPGLPAKPYGTADYLRADANIQGINKAIQWAADNRYRTVVLPTGSYAICYPRSILIDRSRLTVDFNGSTLKVIYDSDRQSPFDLRQGVTDYYNFPSQSQKSYAISLLIQKAVNARVVNLKLIGCKEDRSFSNAAEAAVEWTYGIMLANGSSHCEIRNCSVSSYMGDNISIENSSYVEMAEFGLGLTMNDIDRSTGALTAASGPTLVSQLISLPAGSYDSFLIAGAGYARLTEIAAKEVDVFYYGADNTFISAYEGKKIYTPISIPPGARKLRFLFRNETSALKNMQMTLKFGLTPHHNAIEHCEIYNTHRGGITLGGNYNRIAHCILHDGTGLLDRKPLFPDSTRYGINQEDSYGDNCVIANNLFYNLHHGVLAGCWTVDVQDNHFYNMTGNGIVLYTLHAANVHRNYLYRCQTGISLMTAYASAAHVHIENNTLVHAYNSGMAGNGYRVFYERNTIVDCYNFALPDDDRTMCRGNRFIWTANYAGAASPNVTANRIEDCYFECIGPQREIGLRSGDIRQTVMTNVNVRMQTRNEKLKAETVVFDDCRFVKCLLNNHIYTVKSRTALIRDSRLTDTVVKIGNINTPGESPVTKLSHCRILAETVGFLFQSEFNTGYGWIEADRCDIEISNAGFLYVLTNVFNVAGTVSLFLTNSAIQYTGSGRLALHYYNPAVKRAVRTFADARNVYAGIQLPAPEAGIVIDYDPAKEGLAPPDSGHWFRGDVYGHATPAAGGYAGWICVKAGIASRTAWSAGAAKAKGDVVYAGSYVYEAAAAGTTGTRQPAWPTAAGATVTDGTVVWTMAGDLAVFKPWGPIST